MPPRGQHCPTRGNCATATPAWSLVLGAFRLLRGPWPAKSEKRARFFPLLQPAAIVGKVNTPHSLAGKSSSQEWKEIKSLPQPSHGESTRAGLCYWGPSGDRGTRTDSGPESTSTHKAFQPLMLLSSGHCLLPPSVWGYLGGQKRQIGDSGCRGLHSVLKAWCPQLPL